MTFDVRRLGAPDAQAYRTIRLDALEASPAAFDDSVEEAIARPSTYWDGLMAGDRAFFGVFTSKALVGCANFMPEMGQKTRHIGWIYGVYLAPEARGSGAADLLLNTIFAHAKQTGALQVHIGVSTTNPPAQKLYQRAGFKTYGTAPRSMFVEGDYIDEFLMVRYLDKEDKK
jgi:RimJ/RimL family protein N-acetyltransferase